MFGLQYIFLLNVDIIFQIIFGIHDSIDDITINTSEKPIFRASVTRFVAVYIVRVREVYDQE